MGPPRGGMCLGLDESTDLFSFEDCCVLCFEALSGFPVIWEEARAQWERGRVDGSGLVSRLPGPRKQSWFEALWILGVSPAMSGLVWQKLTGAGSTEWNRPNQGQTNNTEARQFGDDPES